MGVVSIFCGRSGSLPHVFEVQALRVEPGVSGRSGISRARRGVGAWRRTCCYWFCARDGEGRPGIGSIAVCGFWAIIEQQKKSLLNTHNPIAVDSNCQLSVLTVVREDSRRNLLFLGV